MLQERDVFREIIRLLGLALLIYGLYMALQSAISVLYFTPLSSINTNWLVLIRPLSYTLLGLWFLLAPSAIAAFAYPRSQTGEWGHRQILATGIKLSGLWLILAHLGTFQQDLQRCLSEIAMLGRYQVFTNTIWPAVAIYLVIIIIGIFMFRYQPRAQGVDKHPE